MSTIPENAAPEELDQVFSQISKPLCKKDFPSYHTQLHAQAKFALAQAKEMAKMQAKIERQQKRQKSIAELLNLPFNYNSRCKLTKSQLVSMNIPTLQVIVNDLHSEIESELTIIINMIS